MFITDVKDRFRWRKGWRDEVECEGKGQEEIRWWSGQGNRPPSIVCLRWPFHSISVASASSDAWPVFLD